MISLKEMTAVPEGISKVDTLVHGGGDAVIKLQATEGNIKVVRTNP